MQTKARAYQRQTKLNVAYKSGIKHLASQTPTRIEQPFILYETQNVIALSFELTQPTKQTQVANVHCES